MKERRDMEWAEHLKEEREVLEFIVQSNYIENERSAMAHEDALDAWRWLQGEVTLTLPVLLELHRRITHRLMDHGSGKLRKVWVRVGDRVCPPPERVQWLVEQIVQWTPTTEKKIRAWHIDFERIHPFADGNGRTGRHIMNWQRVKAGLPLLVIHEGDEQREYYGWF